MLTTIAILIPISLAIATDLALRPWIANGVATPDIPLLALFWIAHWDSRWRVHALALALALARASFGLDSPVVGFVPAALACECVLLCRRRVHLRDRWVRGMFIPIPMLVLMTSDTLLRYRTLADLELGQIVWGMSAAALLGFALFSILDLMAPSLVTRDPYPRRQIVR